MKFHRYPIISSGAEHLVMGYLMRRNILTFKAPPNHEGYDLVCIHPSDKDQGEHLRIQVKSRLATDSPLAFPVRKESLEAFDYLVLVLLNVGNFYGRAKRNPAPRGASTPTIYTFPQSFVKRHFDGTGSWKKVSLHQLRLDRYRDDRGIELIARRLEIEYPQPKLRKRSPFALPTVTRVRKPR